MRHPTWHHFACSVPTLSRFSRPKKFSYFYPDVGPEQSQPSPLFNSGDKFVLSTQPPDTSPPNIIPDAISPSKSVKNLIPPSRDLAEKTIRDKGQLLLTW
jgi:hypothetical protein